MLDKALTEAIAEVVAEAGQPASVAHRLTAWLTRLSETDLGQDENTQFLANVRNALMLEDGDAD
jgi:hypothetical protein